MAVIGVELMHLPARVIAEATGASVRSAQRWRAGTSPRRRAYRRRLDEVGAVLDLLGPGMSPAGRVAWLTAPSAFVGSRRPVDLLAAGEFDRARGAARAYAGGDVT